MVKKGRAKKAVRQTGQVPNTSDGEGETARTPGETVVEPDVTGRKYALIITLETYRANDISEVRLARADAQGLRQTLLDLGYNQDNITTLIDEHATKTTMESHIERFLRNIRVEDECVIYYAGHGFARSGLNYITAWDTTPTDMANTSVPLNTLMRQIRDSRCNKVLLFLDSCSSGLPLNVEMRDIYSHMSDEEIEDHFRGAQYNVVFASCRNDESSYPLARLRHGIWTYHLLEALNGDVPSAIERNRYVTALSLQTYLSRTVPVTAREIITPPINSNPVRIWQLHPRFLSRGSAASYRKTTSRGRRNRTKKEKGVFKWGNCSGEGETFKRF